MEKTEEKKKTSLVQSAFWFLINNVLNIAFPFATGIYVARVLLPETIGLVTSAQNIVQYFVILAFLGIPTYGLREISKARNDRNELNKVYSELFVINLISTIAFSAVYLLLIFIVPSYRENIFLYLICGGLIALNALNNTWLFEGLEKFKFISIRNLLFKVLMFVILIFLVRSDSDFLWYSAITVIGTAGNYIINFVFSQKYVSLEFKELNLKRHMKSIMFLVVVNLAIEIYSLVDITMLDIFSEKDNIAFYKYGSSIARILLQVVNTFTMVLIPRISLLYKEGKMDEFNRLLSKVFTLIFLIAIPMIIGIQFTSSFLLCKIYGDAYISSSYVLDILSGILLISPIGYLLGSRTLLVTGNERKMVIPVGIGAIVNVIGNLILIPFSSEIGAAVASLIGEIVVMIIYVLLGSKFFKLSNVFIDILKIFISSIAMTLLLIFIYFLIKNELWRCILSVSVTPIFYFSLLWVIKESNVRDFFLRIKNKIRVKK